MKPRFAALHHTSQPYAIRFSEALRRRTGERAGQGLVEYALILALIAILVIVALNFLQPQIANTLNKVANNL